MSKLWIIGDSFANTGDKLWTNKICKKFKGEEYWISTAGSRDAQTVLDIFLKNLHHIKPDDFVIMVLPTIARYRLPLKFPKNDVLLRKEINKIEHADFFIGYHQYNTWNEDRKLEEPLTGLHENELLSKVSLIVNSSNAFKNNFISIIESLKNYLPFEFFIWSWTNELQSKSIIIKEQIKKELGFWETLSDEYEKTNGTSGEKNNEHWSDTMHQSFTDYIFVKFPQFFNL